MAEGPCGSLADTGTGPPTDNGSGLCGISYGPAELDMYFYQGDDERRSIRWLDTDGNPMADLTSAAIAMQLRTGPADTDPTPLCSVSVGDGITITDGPNAAFEVLFENSKTALLTGSVPYYYDLQVEPVGGDLKTILRGKIFFDLDVTR